MDEGAMPTRLPESEAPFIHAKGDSVQERGEVASRRRGDGRQLITTPANDDGQPCVPAQGTTYDGRFESRNRSSMRSDRWPHKV